MAKSLRGLKFNTSSLKTIIRIGLAMVLNIILYNFSAYFNSIVNYENELEDKPTYSNFGLSFSKNASKFMLSYGKQGGLMCYGGVCR